MQSLDDPLIPCRRGHVAPRSKDGHCIQCRRDAAKLRRAKNPEKDTARTREWRIKNPEKSRAAHQRWSVANAIKLRPYRKAASAKWRADHPEEYRLRKRLEEAKRRKAVGSWSTDDVERMMNLQRGKCAACKSQLVSYEIDHVIPLARGGTNWPDNLQLLCVTCNRSKGAKHPTEFMQSIGYLL